MLQGIALYLSLLTAAVLGMLAGNMIAPSPILWGAGACVAILATLAIWGVAISIIDRDLWYSPAQLDAICTAYDAECERSR